MDEIAVTLFIVGVTCVPPLYWLASYLAGGTRTSEEEARVMRRQLTVLECLLTTMAAIAVYALTEFGKGGRADSIAKLAVTGGVFGFSTIWAYCLRRTMPRRTRRDRAEFAALGVLLVPATLALTASMSVAVVFWFLTFA